MFNFNNKDKQPEENIEEEPYVACISYKIGKDKIVTVDVTVEDYSEYPISQLCLILDLLSSDASYMQTVEILKEGFMNAKEQEALEYIYVHLSKQVSNKIIKTLKETNQSQPCIKPSQMLQG
tara:strand:+ start:3505 stop:3870 length:366 start_codon:yes stop_codon:yes gene_type:complete